MRYLLLVAILLNIITNARATDLAIAINEQEARIIQIENTKEVSNGHSIH